jgi:hypothetical protein
MSSRFHFLINDYGQLRLSGCLFNVQMSSSCLISSRWGSESAILSLFILTAFMTHTSDNTQSHPAAPCAKKPSNSSDPSRCLSPQRKCSEWKLYLNVWFFIWPLSLTWFTGKAEMGIDLNCVSVTCWWLPSRCHTLHSQLGVSLCPLSVLLGWRLRLREAVPPAQVHGVSQCPGKAVVPRMGTLESWRVKPIPVLGYVFDL